MERKLLCNAAELAQMKKRTVRPTYGDGTYPARVAFRTADPKSRAKWRLAR